MTDGWRKYSWISFLGRAMQGRLQEVWLRAMSGYGNTADGGLGKGTRELLRYATTCVSVIRAVLRCSTCG